MGGGRSPVQLWAFAKGKHAPPLAACPSHRCNVNRHVDGRTRFPTGCCVCVLCKPHAAPSDRPAPLSLCLTPALTAVPRRVLQFGTMSYIITSNLMYYHDGDKWVTRDWATILDRWSKKRRGGVAPA